MKNILLSLALLGGFTAHAAINLPTVEQAKETAKQKGKPALILWHGSDWLPKATTDKLELAFNELRAAQPDVVLGQYDDTLGQERGARQKVLPVTEYDLPAAVMIAADGTYITTLPKNQLTNPDKLKKATAEALALTKKFTALRQTAKSTKGTEAATSAGKALCLVPYTTIQRYRELIDIINKQDPDNKTGYRDAFCYGHEAVWKMLDGILNANGKKGKERDFAGAIARTEQALKSDVLPKEARQMWLAAQSYTLRARMDAHNEKDNAPLLALYKRIVKLGAETDYGRGAAFFLNYYTPGAKVVIERDYYDHHSYAFEVEKEWHIDVTPHIGAPGQYEFCICKPKSGLKARNFRLYCNGKLLQTIAAEGCSAVFTVSQKPPFHVRYEVRVDVTCTNRALNAKGYISMTPKS